VFEAACRGDRRTAGGVEADVRPSDAGAIRDGLRKGLARGQRSSTGPTHRTVGIGPPISQLILHPSQRHR
jgi:hypothetical protein